MTASAPAGVARPAPATTEANALERRLADRFRVPKARHAMILHVPRGNGKEAKLTVLEMKEGVRLSLDPDGDGIGVKHVDLALSEVNWLTDALNRMRRRVASRPEYRP